MGAEAGEAALDADRQTKRSGSKASEFWRVKILVEIDEC